MSNDMPFGSEIIRFLYQFNTMHDFVMKCCLKKQMLKRYIRHSIPSYSPCKCWCTPLNSVCVINNTHLDMFFMLKRYLAGSSKCI